MIRAMLQIRDPLDPDRWSTLGAVGEVYPAWPGEYRHLYRAPDGTMHASETFTLKAREPAAPSTEALLQESNRKLDQIVQTLAIIEGTLKQQH